MRQDRTVHPLVRPVLAWYADQARDLPWRAADRTPWGVLVSEMMLQQTPVARVQPGSQEWLERWPTPAHLAAAPTTEAELRALSGVGAYTAAAVVLDTNVRRVQGRALAGEALPPVRTMAEETRRANAVVPADDAWAARWNVAAMELGDLVCTARAPASLVADGLAVPAGTPVPSYGLPG